MQKQFKVMGNKAGFYDVLHNGQVISTQHLTKQSAINGMRIARNRLKKGLKPGVCLCEFCRHLGQ